MKKSAAIALFAFAMLPFSACSNDNEQTAYMQNPKAEENAREAEQAEEQFAKLTSKDEAKAPEKTSEKVSEKTPVKKAAKTQAKAEKPATGEAKRKPASTKEDHVVVSHVDRSHKVWTVQLGAFKMKENAEKLTTKLKHDGFPVLMVDKGQSKSGELYLVHLEPTPNKTEAEKWQSDLKLKSFDSTLTSKQD